MRPATALAPTLENGLQSTQNRPRISPAAPSDARFAPLRASPTCGNTARHRPATLGAGIQFPIYKEGRTRSGHRARIG